MTVNPHMSTRSPEPVRHLSVTNLGLAPRTDASEDHGSNLPSDPPLDPDNPILVAVRQLLKNYGGVIFVGPPGTSKSWYAAKIAHALTDGDISRIRFIQFHPSYQYEDFVEGFIPLEHGGFELVDKHLLEMCETAANQTAVLVIDELSRGDPGRIFGEALTYVEKTKRGLPFHLASGHECEGIPDGLVFLATMNPLDRGVDEVDAAFERRFGKIAMDPNPDFLDDFLTKKDVPDSLRTRILAFFRWINARAKDNPFARIGHTFFLNVRDDEDLRRLWDHQLRFIFDKAYQLDPDGHREVRQRWDRMLDASTPSDSSSLESPVASDQVNPAQFE